MHRFLCISLLLGGHLALSLQATSLCSTFSLVLTSGQCSDLNSTNEYFIHFCSVLTGVLDQRCCANGTTLIGLDLGNCSLTNFTAATVSGLSSAASGLLLLSLAPNPNVSCPQPAAFLGQTALRQLLLPSGACAGAGGCPPKWRPEAAAAAPWLRCLPPPDPCGPDTPPGEGCPANSSAQCVPTGPGLFACDCSEGWGGYRCMRRAGRFPYGKFAGGWLPAVLAGCLALWLLERRYVGRRMASSVEVTSVQHVD